MLTTLTPITHLGTQHTHTALPSPLWGHIAVAGCASRPICGHCDLVGGNRSWWWCCQQSSWWDKNKDQIKNRTKCEEAQQIEFLYKIKEVRLTSWHGHGGAGYHPHGDTIVASRGDGRGIHGCRHPIWLDHSCVMDNMRRCSIERLCVVSTLLLRWY